jgi:hypothetical protein
MLPRKENYIMTSLAPPMTADQTLREIRWPNGCRRLGVVTACPRRVTHPVDSECAMWTRMHTVGVVHSALDFSF